MATINYNFVDLDSTKRILSKLDEQPILGEQIQGLFFHDDVYEVVRYDPCDIKCALGGRVDVRRIEIPS